MKLSSLKVDIGWSPLSDFSLLGVDNKRWRLSDVRGKRGTVVMFICNHCPYVKAIASRLSHVALKLSDIGVSCIAINSNDSINYPDDDFKNMQLFAKHHRFNFPYVVDETQSVARDWGAVCTPEFYGLDEKTILLYRGRLDGAGKQEPNASTSQDLVSAMHYIATNGSAPPDQYPSVGCSIKWKL